MLRRFLPLPALVVLACSSGAAPRTDLPPPEYEVRGHGAAVASVTADASADLAPTSTGDAKLAEIGDRFLAGWLARQPVRATEAGDHRFDGKWPDVSEAGDASYQAFLLATNQELDLVDDATLSLEASIDKRIIQNQIALGVLAIHDLRAPENDPLFYTALIGDGLDPLVTREFASPSERAKSLASRLEGIPALVAVAKKRLGTPPEIHTKTAIEQNQGLIALCKKDLADLIRQAGAEGPALDKAAKTAAIALEDFQTFLEKDLKKRSTGNFRLGRALYEKKLRLLLDDVVDADRLAKDARALLDATRHEMLATSKELWPELVKGKPWKDPKDDAEERGIIREVLAKLAEDHSTNATIVKDAEQTLAAATAFVKEKDLVRLPDEPCKIIEMPEYRRGVAIAYCDSSGPLEAHPETFYAIAPTPKDWPKKRVDSFYREYNKSMLFDLTVHEAMPGHFLQAMHNNRFPSKVRAVFSHGAFVEGWAVYTEWVMAKHGFGGARVRMQRQKMALRMAANAIIDNGVHAGTMTEKDAMKLMTEDAFQEEGEAVGKWRRARLTSGQLSTYFYGFSEHMKLRKAAEAKPGFQERAYHDEIIAHGSPAPRYMRELMAAKK